MSATFPQLDEHELTETANIGTNHGDVVDTSHTKDTRERAAELDPFAQVVTEPFADMRTCTRKRGTGDDEGPLSRTAGKHRLARGRGHHRAVQVVCVVLNETVSMDGIRLKFWVSM